MGRRSPQIEINFDEGRWGGRRKGAGRKPGTGRRPVPHRVRPELNGRHPVHVTCRLLPGLPRLRGFELAKVLRRAFVRGCDKRVRSSRAPDAEVLFRICHFSVQGNHIHLICEARDAAELARGIQGWKIRVTRGLNRNWHRIGTVFDGRYHAQVMKTPLQVRNGLLYVLHNAVRHGHELPKWANGIDPFSSAWYFDGWSDDAWRHGLPPPAEDPDAPGEPVAPPGTWLLRTGWWKHYGLIDVDEVPPAAKAARRRTA